MAEIPIPASDPTFMMSPDKRVYLKMKKDRNIPSPSSSGDYGIGVYKFTAKNADGSQAVNYNAALCLNRLSCIQICRCSVNESRSSIIVLTISPMLLLDINKVRERAYGNTSGNITVGQLTDDFLIAERGREFYYEAQRRTDLIRFGKFTGSDYLWQWKGGTMQDLQPAPT